MFLGITLLFLDFSGTMSHYVGWMSRVQLLEAVLALNVAVVAALVVLTLVFGRIYCSVVCPLGVMQDIIAWVGRRVSKRRYSYSKELRWLRYPVLALFVVAALLGIGSVVQLLAPYSAYGRIAANVLQPLWQAGNNVLAGISEYYDSYMSSVYWHGVAVAHIATRCVRWVRHCHCSAGSRCSRYVLMQRSVVTALCAPSSARRHV